MLLNSFVHQKSELPCVLQTICSLSFYHYLSQAIDHEQINIILTDVHLIVECPNL